MLSSRTVPRRLEERLVGDKSERMKKGPRPNLRYYPIIIPDGLRQKHDKSQPVSGLIFKAGTSQLQPPTFDRRDNNTEIRYRVLGRQRQRQAGTKSPNSGKISNKQSRLETICLFCHETIPRPGLTFRHRASSI